METTPQMDRQQLKRMGHSLIAFSRLRSLTKMSRQQLADMPKEVMIACAPNEIALVWEKLPEHLQNDIDILKYQYCTEHTTTAAAAADDFANGDVERDENDGPPPRRLICCYCNVNEVNVATDNTIEISPDMTSEAEPRAERLFLNCCCYK